MALPTLESTWTHVNNTQLVYTTEADMTKQVFWRMTRALVACPSATVRFSNSSTGTSATIDGVDNLTTFASVQTRTTTLTTANTSFIVVRLAAISSTFDVCIAHCSVNISSLTMSFSRGGNFVVAATATHHPTATDIIYAPDVTFGTAALTNSASNKRFHYSYTAAGDQLRFLVTTEGTFAACSFTEIGVCDGQYATTWTGAEAHFTHCGTAARLSATDTAMKTRFPITFVTAQNASYWGYLAGPTGGSAAPYDNASEWPISQAYGVPSLTSNQRPLICRFKDFYIVPDGLADGTYFSAAATREFIVMGNLLLPWDGSLLL